MSARLDGGGAHFRPCGLSETSTRELVLDAEVEMTDSEDDNGSPDAKLELLAEEVVCCCARPSCKVGVKSPVSWASGSFAR